ncbi:MAG: hypothetical protein HYY14_06760 [Candidatus Omnitrophica bacterium]|nr:hypothetical protein [Candidatus Omnitrophota bacterium]
MISVSLYPTRVAAQEEEINPDEVLAAKVEELDGTDWDIQVNDREGKAASYADTIHFRGVLLSTDSLEKDGYTPTNYTPTLSRDFATFILQSMKRNEKEDTAVVRAELRGDAISGVVTKQTKKGQRTTFVFSGVLSRPAVEEAPVSSEGAELEPEPVAAPIPQVEPAPEASPVPDAPEPEPTQEAAPKPAPKPQVEEKPLPWWKRMGRGR